MPRITTIHVTDLLGIKEAHLEPNGRSITIGGRNAQGKSSLLRSIMMVLSGSKTMVPKEPVHRDARRGEGTVELDNGYVVTLKIKRDRTCTWQVTRPDEPEFRTDDMSHIKAMLGPYWFDPSQFKALSKRDKITELLKLSGVGRELADLNREREKLYEERTGANREVKRLEGICSSLSRFAGVPKEEESVSVLAEELVAARRAVAAYENDQAEIKRLDDVVQTHRKEIEEIRQQIERLENKRKDLRAKIEMADARAAACQLNTEKFKAPDIKALEIRLASVEETNKKIRANKQADFNKESLANAESEHERIDGEIKAIDNQKAKLLKRSKLPVEGLEFDEEDLRLNGTLWDDVAESEQWRASCGVAFAANPEGFVFMANSGGLDKQSRAALLQQAQACGVQFFVEVVDGQDDAEVLLVIESGEIKTDRIGSVVGAKNEAGNQEDDDW